MAGIDETSIAAVRIRKRAPQSVLIRRHNDKMNMVGHQAIAPYLRPGPLRRIGQEVAVQGIVAILEKSLFPPVAALRHMIGETGYNQSGKPSHASYIRNFMLLVNCHRNT